MYERNVDRRCALHRLMCLDQWGLVDPPNSFSRLLYGYCLGITGQREGVSYHQTSPYTPANRPSAPDSMANDSPGVNCVVQTSKHGSGFAVPSSHTSSSSSGSWNAPNRSEVACCPVEGRFPRAFGSDIVISSIVAVVRPCRLRHREEISQKRAVGGPVFPFPT